MPPEEQTASLLDGPRGRRLLLEYALASELAQHPVRPASSLGSLVARAEHRDESSSRGSRRRASFGWPTSSAQRSGVSAGQAATEAAERLHAVSLLSPTGALLRAVLAASAGHASYWQAPAEVDRLLDMPPMRVALRRVDALVSASPLTAWWQDPAPLREQHRVCWEGSNPAPHGDWWSRPPQSVASSARLLVDGSPAALWFVEDSLGWRRATSVRVIPPEQPRVHEIRHAADWAALCARFPRVADDAQQRSWSLASGHSGRWVVPDWTRVAASYDGVHLSVRAYLTAAGTVIPSDSPLGGASMIAGWNPDATHWLRPALGYGTGRTRWRGEDSTPELGWVEESGARDG